MTALLPNGLQAFQPTDIFLSAGFRAKNDFNVANCLTGVRTNLPLTLRHPRIPAGRINALPPGGSKALLDLLNDLYVNLIFNRGIIGVAPVTHRPAGPQLMEVLDPTSSRDTILDQRAREIDPYSTGTTARQFMAELVDRLQYAVLMVEAPAPYTCLLYTSDAADE